MSMLVRLSNESTLEAEEGFLVQDGELGIPQATCHRKMWPRIKVFQLSVVSAQVWRNVLCFLSCML
jgi:hypothetical protein